MRPIFKIIISILLVFAIIFVVVLLKTNHDKFKITTNKSTKVFEPQLSSLNFPLLISVGDIEKLANVRIKKVIFDKKIQFKDGPDSLLLKITRMGDLDFRMEDNHLNTSVPLKLEIVFEKKITRQKKILLFKEKPITLLLSARFRSSIHLKENMDVSTSTILKEVVWNEEPIVNILGFEFNLKTKINEILEEKSSEIVSKIDQQILNKINVKKPTAKVWDNLQKSIIANKENGLYIRIQPQSLSVHVDKSLNDSIKLNLIVTSKIYARFAADTLLIRKVKFPARIKVMQNGNVKPSTIFLQGLFPLTKLNEIISSKLVGKTFDVKGLNLKIKKIEIRNEKNNIYLKIKHEGDVFGEVVLKGIPKLSKDKKHIFIDNVYFENKLNDQVFDSFTDLLHAQILLLLKENVAFDISKIMNSIPDLARTTIGKSKVAKKADISLHHLEIEKVRIELTKYNIQILVSGHSNFEIALKQTSFKFYKK